MEMEIEFLAKLVRDDGENVMVDDGADDGIWLPRGRIRMEGPDRYGLHKITLPARLAQEKGIL